MPMDINHISAYGALVLFTALICSSLTSARIACFLAQRWSLSSTTRGWFMIFGAGSAGLLMWHIGMVVIFTYGAMAGAALTVLGLVGTALSWGYVVAGTRVFERILAGLDNKMGV